MPHAGVLENSLSLGVNSVKQYDANILSQIVEERLLRVVGLEGHHGRNATGISDNRTNLYIQLMRFFGEAPNVSGFECLADHVRGNTFSRCQQKIQRLSECAEAHAMLGEALKWSIPDNPQLCRSRHCQPPMIHL